ncbi:triose-phosphate isomerase [Gammaproteobacteria bacterium LSUCC0112]|nr:triose-phosphate isomerase [Gammaproteobacteria bacterium LSUCC0112]
MRRALVAANWKMHGNRIFIQELVSGLIPALSGGVNGVDIVICPPFPYLQMVDSLIKGTEIVLGAQDVGAHESGPYTGEVSASMLADFRVRYVIVGHSERRSLMNECDQHVAEKFVAAQQSGLIPVLCVGETLAERDQGIAGQVVERQLSAVIDQAGVTGFSRAVIAYEPVWAIGTGRSASVEQAQEMHAAIRQLIALQDDEVAQSVQIIYGGSVNPENAPALFAQPDIDGGLIGGASLNADSFVRICQSVS